MINILDKKDCVGCNACVQRCPKQCISMQGDEQGFLYPKVDVSRCMECGLCDKVCPVINQSETSRPLYVFAATNPEDEVRMNSSSGGIFFAIAKSVLDDGGAVFGAKFNGNWEVTHGYAETLEEAKAFCGSKYVQSRIGDAFTQTEKFLKEGRKVLFSGTPCQIMGLKKFLRKDYENLLAVDVVCHGAPSPLVWREYLKYITARPTGALDGKNTDFQSLNAIPAIAGISFRDKKLGWEKFGFSVLSAATNGSGQNSDFPASIRSNGGSHASSAGEYYQQMSVNGQSKQLFFETLDKNLYMQIFLKNLDLRPSCYACPAKCGKSHSDITLADFWGIKKRIPEFYDFNGVSLVMTNTSQGSSLIDSLHIDKRETSYEVGLAGNPSIEKSVAIPRQYSLFWENFIASGFAPIPSILAKIKPSLGTRLKCKAKGIVKKIFRLC